MAKFWDLIVNSGRFKQTLPLFLGDKAFEAISAFTEWLFPQVNQTYGIALDKLFALVFEFMTQYQQLAIADVQAVMREDFMRVGTHGWPKYLGEMPEEWKGQLKQNTQFKNLPKRQQQHH